MELPELQQGLQNIQQAQLPPDAAPAAEAPWLNMDNLMQGYGNWFDNDKGLGEMLLSQLRSHGVDTQAATEAMLRELLQGLVDDLNMLQQKLTGFTTAIAQQMQQTQAVADSVQSAIDSQQPNPTALQMQPPMGTFVMPQMNDVPPDIGADFGAEQPPAEQPPAEQPPAEQPPAEQPPAEQPPAEMTVSDIRTKYVLSDAGLKQIKCHFTNKNNTGVKYVLSDAGLKQIKRHGIDKNNTGVKYVLSDAGLKQIKRHGINKNSICINRNIVAACNGGF